MKRDMILKLAASTMVIGVTLTGCGPFGIGSKSVASSSDVSAKPATVKDGAKYAKKAEKALAKGQTEKAIAYAERSVAGVGSDPETRALLGHSYMAAGRFSSAERSFEDAMELGQNDARTVLSLGMAMLAQGKADQTKRLVVQHRQVIPTADYGLALALAGDAPMAVEVLSDAIRSDNATGRTRQNLGLAYALDGRWKEAKLMAVQDMTPATVDSRMMQWAQMARPGAYETRVATLLNVKPDASDPGQPVRLALNAATVMPTSAKATPKADYSREVASFDKNAPLPAIGPAPRGPQPAMTSAAETNTKVQKVDVPESVTSAKPQPVEAPLIKAVAEAVKTAPIQAVIAQQPVVETPQAAQKEFVVEEKSKPHPVKVAAAQAVSTAKPVLQKASYIASSNAAPSNTLPTSTAPTSTATAKNVSGTHLVQLGVFSSPENVKRAWGILSSQNTDLKSFKYATSTVKVRGKTLYRLAAMGFGNEQSAKAMCSGIQAKGGNCIVRNLPNNNAAVRMAAKKPKVIASR